MKKIYIAKDYKNNPLSIVLADNKEIASAFFLGQSLSVNEVEEIDMKNLENQSLCVLTTSYEKEHYDVKVGETIIVTKRGL